MIVRFLRRRNNSFNLQDRLTDLQDNSVQIVYDAQGQKTAYTDHSNPNMNKVYSNGFVYQNGTLTYMPLPEGYYSNGEYFAVIKDYLGSTRVVLKNNSNTYNLSNEVLEVNHYDPWGVEFGMSEEPFGVQDYKHQGKERITIGSKSWQDHGARWANQARWDTPDPLMEDFYPMSPYVFCSNNPVRRIDFDGRSDWEIDKTGYGLNIEDSDLDENDRPFGRPDYEQPTRPSESKKTSFRNSTSSTFFNSNQRENTLSKNGSGEDKASSSGFSASIGGVFCGIIGVAFDVGIVVDAYGNAAPFFTIGYATGAEAGIGVSFTPLLNDVTLSDLNNRTTQSFHAGYHIFGGNVSLDWGNKDTTPTYGIGFSYGLKFGFSTRVNKTLLGNFNDYQSPMGKIKR